MDLVYIGKIVDTHGIRGELRISSDFEYKNLVFKPGVNLYIDNKEYTIESYRYHKVYDMVVFEGYYNINDVLDLKRKDVYVNREILNLDENNYLLNDLINCNIYLDDKVIGKVLDYTVGVNPLLIVDVKGSTKYIPNNKEFIKNVNVSTKSITLSEIARGVIE